MNWRNGVEDWTRREWTEWLEARRGEFPPLSTVSDSCGEEKLPGPDDLDGWERLYTRAEPLASMISALSAEERDMLSSLLLNHGAKPVAEAVALSVAGRSPGRAGMGLARLRQALAGLRRKGLVMGLRKGGGDLHVAVPRDTGLAAHGILFPLREPQPPGTDGMQATAPTRQRKPSPPDERGLAACVYTIVRAAADEPLAVTRSGSLAKPSVRQLQKAFAWCEPGEPDGAGAGVGYSHADLYGWPLAAALDQALALGLLRLQPRVSGGGEYAADPEAITALLAGGRMAFERRLIERWYRTALPEELPLYHGAAGLLQLSADSGWVTYGELADWLERFGLHGKPDGGQGRAGEAANDDGPAAPATAHADRIWHGWVRLLASFGWLELREGDGSDARAAARRDWACRWRLEPGIVRDAPVAPEPIAAAIVYVQPNLELLVPPELPMAVRWELQSITTPLRRDTYDVYRLDRRRVERVIAGGRDGEAILGFLAACSRHELPESVVQAVRDWERATVVQQQDDPAAIHIYASPMLERQADSGLLPATAQEEYPGLLLTGLAAGPAWRADGKLPKREELYPFLADIPAMWWKEKRAYHATTRKEIVRLALDAGSELMLLRQGETMRVVPDRLAEELNSWRIEGCSDSGRISLAPEEWHEMQLLLPGINE